MRKFYYLTLCLFLGIGIAVAQTRQVKGVVISDEDDEPVIGASVVVVGTTLGTVTNADGEFTISNVPTSATKLMVSYVGMTTQEVPISDNVAVRLLSDTQELEEVVITAQGLTRKEKSIGYSTTKIDGDKLTIARQTDLGNSIAGKVAGARFFGKSGATFDAGKIVLRGSSSFTDPVGSEPIYVVDGSITNKNSVNMDDVESINVLKGPAATALYGSDGGNGAVIITTKRAKEGGKGHIEVSHTLGFERYYNHYKLQKDYGGGAFGADGQVLNGVFEGQQYDTMSPEFLYGIYENMRNSDGSYFYDFGEDVSWGARFDPNVRMASPLYFDQTSSKYGIADPYVARLNLADLYRTGVSNTTNVSFSKAGKDYSTRISFTNAAREGIIDNSNAVRRYLGINTVFKPIDWLNVSLDYKFTYRRDHNGAEEGYSGARTVMMEYTQWGQTSVNLKDYKDYMRPDGSWRAWNTTSESNPRAAFHDNPFAVYNEANLYSTWLWNVFTGDVEALLPYNFKAGFRVMGNMRTYNHEEKWGTGSVNFTDGYNESQDHTRELRLQGRVTWGDRFIEDRLSLDAAAFIEEKNYNYGYLHSTTVDGLIIPNYYNLSASSGTATTDNSETHYKTRSIFANATVGFDDTYFLDGSIRRDWDSKLPDANNGFTYGGLSASIMLNQFMKGARWLNYWKLRASAAQVGSTLNAYNVYPVYSVKNSSNVTYKYNNMTYLYPPATLRNPEIKPTISTSYEIGTEFRMFNNRFWGDFNLYRRDSKNQILNMTVAPQSGYNSRQINTGLVRNQGFEISLGASVVKTRDFLWNIEGNISKNLNKLVRLNDDIKEYMIQGNSFYDWWYLYAVEGRPLGVINSYSRWLTNDEGKPILTANSSAAWGGGYRPTWERATSKDVGTFQPDFTGGFSTDFHYKGITLAANFDFMVGGKMVTWTNMWGTGSGLIQETSKLNNNGVNEREPISKGGGVYVEGVDTDGNPVNCYINAYYYYLYKAMYNNDNWVVDRTYLKMRELSLSYDIPKSFLAKTKIGLTNASVSLVATNPWLIYSKVPNVDPSETGDNWLEGGQVASSRSLGFTVKLGF